MLQLVEREQLAGHFVIESAGTAGYHVGERPDRRTLATARAHGVELPSRARQFRAADFARFDLVLAMDTDNRDRLLALSPDELARGKVLLLRDFEPGPGLDRAVPDPYYGEDDGFERVFKICQVACEGLLAHLRREYRL